ncbi:MAG: lipopolysaccharide biosynthesis protein [Bacteroidales bacterium]|nr:lipopolysaccharide biosynthesis protein [Bacteroidales bacterium]
MPDSLKTKAVSGLLWTAIQKYSVIGMNFVSGIILARLLTPYDYGCIGMLTIFTTIASAVVEGGFASALIQKKRPTQEDYSTVFYWNLGISLLMYAVLYASAPAISRFYEIPLLSSVLRVQGIILIINAVTIIQRNQLRKQFRFKKLAMVSIITSAISLTVTIIMAYNKYGVWALVAQNILASLIPSLIFWLTNKWKPLWCFSIKSFKELFSFGFYMFMTHLVNDLSSSIQSLLIGKIYSPSTLGYYTKAHRTEMLASKSISMVMTQVTYPLYAEAQDNKQRISSMIKRLTLTLSYLTFPLLLILILLANPIFLLLYSDRWLPCVPYFQVLCIAGFATCLQAVNLQAIPAVGKSKTMFVWVLIKRGFGISCIVGGLFLFGMKGLLAGVVINSWFSYFANAGLVSKYIGYKFFRQMLDILPTMLQALIVAVPSYLFYRFSPLSLYPTAAITFVIYAGLYLGISLILKPEAFLYTKEILPILFSKFKKPKKS